MSAAANSVSAAATAWHALTADEVLKRLATSTGKGLDAGEASARLQKYGPNRLPEGKKSGPFKRFLSQFNNVLVYVLLGAGFVKLMLGLWLDASIILGVVAAQRAARLRPGGQGGEGARLDPQHALRRGADPARRRDAHDPGGGAGAGRRRAARVGRQVPGGPPPRRREEPAHGGGGAHRRVGAGGQDHRCGGRTNATVGDRECMAFSGTLVVSGRATGVVVGTGSHTELGRINQMLAGVSPLETPLLRQIKKFGYAITAVVGVVSVAGVRLRPLGAGACPSWSCSRR